MCDFLRQRSRGIARCRHEFEFDVIQFAGVELFGGLNRDLRPNVVQIRESKRITLPHGHGLIATIVGGAGNNDLPYPVQNLAALAKRPPVKIIGQMPGHPTAFRQTHLAEFGMPAPRSPGMRKLGGEVTGRKAIARLDAAQNFQAGNGSRYLGASDPVHDGLPVDTVLWSNNRFMQMPRGVAVPFHMQRQRLVEYVPIAPDGRVRLGKLHDSARLGTAFLIWLGREHWCFGNSLATALRNHEIDMVLQ